MAQEGIEQQLAAAGLDRSPEMWLRRLEGVTPARVLAELARPFAPFSLERLAVLVSPAAREEFDALAEQARRITVQRFGRVMQLYVPLYISNYCVNRCLYCGFRAAGGGRKVRLTVDELVCESEILADAGFRHLLLVSGEDPRHVTVDYLAQAVDQLRGRFASIVLETPPFDTEAYRRLARAGVDGMTLYQETYDRETYAQVHPPGRKSDYGRRLVVHDDAAAAGIPKVNLGALLGLAPWPFEALALGLHVHYLYRRYWRTFVSVSFPRIRRAGSVHFTPAHSADDADLAHMIVALRLAFPDLGLVLSTREPEAIRNRLCFLGITQMSAGSRTSPLGYSRPEVADGQFEVSDERTPAEVAAFLEQHGFDPVWKDWDASIAR